MNDALLATDGKAQSREALAESRRRELEFSALLDAYRAILACNDFPQAAREIVDSWKKLTGAASGYIALLNEDETEIVPLFLDSGDFGGTVDPGPRVPTRGLRGQVHRLSKTVVENNFQSSSWVKFLPQGQVSLENAMLAPLRTDGKTVGLIGVGNKPGGFTKRDARIATAFGEITSIALCNNLTLNALAKSEATVKRLNKELNHQNLKIEAANQELEAFASVVSHDLQEPLRMINCYLQLLDTRYKDVLDADAKDFIDFAVDGANRVKDLTNDLRAYSRIGTTTLPFQPTDCEAVLESAMQNLKVALDQCGAQIEHTPLPTVMGDAMQLTQLLENLIGNAIKFRGDKQPLIRVAAEQTNDLWTFSVQDSGIGIDPKYFQRIFGVFERLHSRKEHPGTGIGLAICKKIAERHGGDIWVESELGRGATFFFSIPIQENIGHERDNACKTNRNSARGRQSGRRETHSRSVQGRQGR
jgi:signal transduction histidine kinase